jgi:hypothetical protein
MGLSNSTKDQTKQSAPGLDIEANHPQTETVGNDGNTLQEIDGSKGEEAGRRIIIWVPIVCAAILVTLGVAIWGLHQLFSGSAS